MTSSHGSTLVTDNRKKEPQEPGHRNNCNKEHFWIEVPATRAPARCPQMPQPEEIPKLE